VPEVKVPGMTLTPALTTFDTTDAMRLGQWWAAALGGSVVDENDGWFVIVKLPNEQLLAFQKIDDPTPGKNRIHLDLTTADVAGDVARLLDSGASKVADREAGGFAWTTLADPDGNQFCVSPEH